MSHFSILASCHSLGSVSCSGTLFQLYVSPPVSSPSLIFLSHLELFALTLLSHRFPLIHPQLPFLSSALRLTPVPCLTLGCLSVQAPWDCSSNQAHAPIRANMTFQVLALSGVTFKSEWLSGKLRLMCTVMEDNVKRCSGLRVLYVWESHLFIVSLSTTITHTGVFRALFFFFIQYYLSIFYTFWYSVWSSFFSLSTLFYQTAPFYYMQLFSKAWRPIQTLLILIQYCLFILPSIFPCILLAHFSPCRALR